MSTSEVKDQVFHDYAAFLRLLLPQACGFLCYDRRGTLVWQASDQHFSLTPDYRNALQDILADPARAAEAGRVSMGEVTAYVAPLVSERGQRLGVLTSLVQDSAGSMPWQFCIDLLRPALRSLQRELSLRMELLDGCRKLRIQASEESLLHQVEKLVHGAASCTRTLRKVLQLCRGHLEIGSAALLIPERGIRLIACGQNSPEAQALMLGEIESRPAVLELVSSGGAGLAQLDQDTLFVPIRDRGALIFSGCSQSDYSEARRRRAGRYIASNIEAVIDRFYDPLTGLMSWPMFEADLIKVCRSAPENPQTAVYCDLDQLHVINDTFGRDAGDEILARVSALLRECFAGHLVTRITADSFAALLADTDVEEARRKAEGLCARVREIEHRRGDQVCRPTVSIGIAPLAADVETAGGALSTAKVACQAAKERGRGRVDVYEPDDQSIIRRFDDIQLVGYISSAIENDRLELLGQPIVPLKEGATQQCFEVLARIIADDGRLVPPAEFLPAAERYQLMEELDRWVVTESLRTLSCRREPQASMDVRVAINLSGQSLGSESFLEFMQERIRKSGVRPGMLCFEITESVAVANIQRAQAFMRALQKMGCRFSLDDFGTGLSSFAYLKLFSVDTLKIDGNFIRDISTNVVSQSVVAAISEVARVMELETVAEYVQDENTAALLRDLGVTWAQGYLFGEPERLDTQLDKWSENAPADAVKTKNSGDGGQRCRTA